MDDWRQTVPGGELIAKGLADYAAGQCTVAGCLVSIARTRLSEAGLLPKSEPNPFPEPERQLYRLLGESDGDAYSRYNALPRELISFERTFERMTRMAETQNR